MNDSSYVSICIIGSKNGRYLGRCSILKLSSCQHSWLRSSLLALLAKFRYALCLQSFATRLACQELPKRSV